MRADTHERTACVQNTECVKDTGTDARSINNALDNGSCILIQLFVTYNSLYFINLRNGIPLAWYFSVTIVY
jgi:hypothetical protein